MRSAIKGFGYKLPIDKIRDYQKIPVEKRLTWLYQGALLRRAYPKKIKTIQDRFREGTL